MNAVRLGVAVREEALLLGNFLANVSATRANAIAADICCIPRLLYGTFKVTSRLVTSLGNFIFSDIGETACESN